MIAIGHNSQGRAGRSGVRRLRWESPDLAEAWEPRLSAALRPRLATSKDDLGRPSVFAVAPFQVPAILRDCREIGVRASVLGVDLPDALWGLVAGANRPGLVWCAVGACDEEDLDSALLQGDRCRVARALRIADCCARAAERTGSDGMRWDLLSAASEYRFLPLGVGPPGFLPCSPGCPHASPEVPAGAFAELVALPTRISVRDGIGEVVTPVFRFVFAADPGVTLSLEHPGAGARPVEGVAQDDLSWRARSIGESRGFGNLPRASVRSLDGLPQRALMIPDMAADWPAFERWSLDWLSLRLTGVQIAHLLMPSSDEPLTFERLAERVLEPGGPYMFSLPFAFHAADMRLDYDVPACFDTVLRRLPSPLAESYCGEMFLGPKGSTTYLHQDVLETDFWMTVIWGRKRWAICPPHGDAERLGPDVDLFDPDVRASLASAGIPVFLAEQDAGDTIFMPARWWHQVENLDATLAISEMIVDAGSANALLARVDVVESEITSEAAQVFREAAHLALAQAS